MKVAHCQFWTFEGIVTSKAAAAPTRWAPKMIFLYITFIRSASVNCLEDFMLQKIFKWGGQRLARFTSKAPESFRFWLHQYALSYWKLWKHAFPVFRCEGTFLECHVMCMPKRFGPWRRDADSLRVELLEDHRTYSHIQAGHESTLFSFVHFYLKQLECPNCFSLENAHI